MRHLQPEEVPMEHKVEAVVRNAIQLVFGPLVEDRAVLEARIDEFFYRLAEENVHCVAIEDGDA